jgi:hypothetical protein
MIDEEAQVLRVVSDGHSAVQGLAVRLFRMTHFHHIRVQTGAQHCKQNLMGTERITCYFGCCIRAVGAKDLTFWLVEFSFTVAGSDFKPARRVPARYNEQSNTKKTRGEMGANERH